MIVIILGNFYTIKSYVKNDYFCDDMCTFYGYYLFKTQLNHPMKDEIISNYPIAQNEIIKTEFLLVEYF